MTSNLDKELLPKTFTPEFLNRIDEIVVFRELSKDNIKAIVKLQLDRVQSRVQERKIKLNFDDSALELLCEKGYDPAMGARPVKRAIQSFVENKLAKELLSGNIADGDEIKISAGKDELFINKINT